MQQMFLNIASSNQMHKELLKKIKIPQTFVS